MIRRRFKYFMPERNEFSTAGEEKLLSVSEYYGVKPRAAAFEEDAAESRAVSLEGYRKVYAGDFVMNYMLAWKGAYGVSDHDGIVSPAYAVYRIDQRYADQRFIHHRLRSEHMRLVFRARSKGIIESRLRLYPDTFLSMEIDLPDLPIQKVIADFLDRETARIDQLIEKKQRLVRLLRERSLSAIEKAVTGDTSLSKLGLHVKILPGYAFASSAFSANEEDIRLLRGANVSPGKVRWEDVVYWPKDEAGGLDRFQLEVGDIVMGMDRPWILGGIRVAEITERDVPALLLQRVCKIIPLKTLSKDFLKLLLSSKKFLGYFEPELTGVSVPHISGDQIAGFRFAYMPVSEQDERAQACQKILKSNDAIIEQAQQSIARLGEFRSALITAAVTGQIDVNTWGKEGKTDRRLEQIEEAMSA